VNDALEPVVVDALNIARRWLGDLSLADQINVQLSSEPLAGAIDVVGIGKAAREMVRAVEVSFVGSVARRFIVCDADSARREPSDDTVRIGAHPLPTVASVQAARELISFLESGSESNATVFVISGGASSLCNLVEPPLTLDDLETMWRFALRAGIDITTLNQLRAATSQIAGGRILQHLRSRESLSLLMVDNVVSGAPWVASGLTYEVNFSVVEVEALIDAFQIDDHGLIERIRAASSHRRNSFASTAALPHRNVVVAEPSMMLSAAASTASALGYHVISLGANVVGEASDVAHQMCEIAHSLTTSEPVCVIAAGEATVSLTGSGTGGRCQEMAWATAPLLAQSDRACSFVAHASDGRDHVAGVAGAWADNATMTRIIEAGINWSRTLEQHNTGPALEAIGQLISGEHTGWNLCDLYVLCVGAGEDGGFQ
jgi:glycerate 2-kinase